ncbi:hypothetical protein GKO32_10020 [Amycolatopsis sp. RM579]|uniref:Uncharacterized protein n=2 Tax=Amycolatopsis pithecellobii TaxID=664692 RepID=A0A6N7Z0S4_9PSEU|nr:hypothetical protein [Amycolatopsis pithecellobii]
MALIRANDTESILAAAMPSLSDSERAAMSRHAGFAHTAVLVFPTTLDGLAAELAQHGITVGAMTPSVVVRDRLSRRYTVPVADLTVGIFHASVPDRLDRPCEVEIFAMVTPPELAHIAADERRHGWENHFALAVPAADAIVLNGLMTVTGTQMRPDGGGYNAHEDSTVLYFRNDHHPAPAYRRLELVSTGRFPDLVTAHRRESVPGTRLLRLLTGAWATQAIATAVELRLPDHLGTTADLATLAAATGCDRESLGRLVRYLSSLGILHASADGYALTDLGRLLRSDGKNSMAALASMYGGPFYRSFAALTDAVRTGAESYERVFGAHHFKHMAADPELAELFHRSMAASNAMFTEVVRLIDFSAARTVVDVAGGNGELLSQVLAAHPCLRGVLVDQPHVLTVAEPALAPFADRCALIPGDFTEVVPTGGDVYLLSRVLHDWDDAQCHTILTTCAANMPEHAELLVIERLLPESAGTESLAIPWDVHMLCNVGGRERTESHYRALLAKAGFTLVDTQPLPLDGYVLRARRER